jgi:hypothetical protein
VESLSWTRSVDLSLREEIRGWVRRALVVSTKLTLTGLTRRLRLIAAARCESGFGCPGFPGIAARRILTTGRQLYFLDREGKLHP